MKLFKKFIKDFNLLVDLCNWCKNSVRAGYFWNGPPDRYVLRLRKDFPEGWQGVDITDGKFRKEVMGCLDDLSIPISINSIKNKLINKFKIESSDEPDVFMSLHKKGACINPHKHFPQANYHDLRFNIFINKTKGGDPVVSSEFAENQHVAVDAGDLIIFSGNYSHNSTEVMEGERIMLSYGFFVTDEYVNKLFNHIIKSKIL